MNKKSYRKGLALTVFSSVVVGCSDPTDKITDIDFSNFNSIPKILAFEFSDGKMIILGAHYRSSNYRNAYMFTNSHLCYGKLSVDKSESEPTIINLVASKSNCEVSEINPFETPPRAFVDEINISLEQKSLGDVRVVDSDISITKIYEPKQLWDFSINIKDYNDYESYASNVPRRFHSNANNKTHEINILNNDSIYFHQQSVDDSVSCERRFHDAFSTNRFNSFGAMRMCKFSDLSPNTYMYKDKDSERFVFIYDGVRYNEVPDDWKTYTDSDVIKR
ncbi:hypothetical protein Q2Y22_001292 [Vibrio vulnificus]|nr:hypothetical protein [Vibrio vulnificus]